jgi:signal transduction histidine kinase
MVQEALTNAAVHAPGAPCSVEIDDSGTTALTVTVTNDRSRTVGDRAAHHTGFGLLGMQERAALVGATLSYGATAAGGWVVVLTIPRDDPPAPAVADVAAEDASQ